ncbi:hypothetical protein PI126_g20022 [Phytophthora idaei]|nr:hypothetical protein PI126_g20022 [Phytophthora idaei]
MDMLESDGWTVKFDRINPQSVCWLRKDCMELLLVKSNRRYRLKATAVAIYRVPSLQAGEQCSQSDSKKIVLRKRTRAASLERWHLRYAHLNFATLQQMARRGIAVGMEDELCEDMGSPCWTCKASKMTRMSYKKTVPRRATRPYQKLMSDMCYVDVVAYDGYEHFQLVHDEASRFLWGFLMRRKQDATEVDMAHLKWLIAQRHRIEVFCSDQGRELLNRSMKAFLEATGIEYIWTNAYSPEENGLVERMNGIVMARVRCLLSAANMPTSLWGEAFQFAVDVINISASSAINGDTPYFRRFGSRPDVSTLRTWGCVVFVFTPKVLRTNKLENPGKPGLFMGYAKHSESYRILNLTNGNINEVRSVEFQEDWTVERSYVGHLLSNRHGKGRYVLPAIIPYVHLPVLHPVTHGSKRSSVEPDDRPTKRCRCDDRAVCNLPVEMGGGPAAVSTDASGRWLLSGNEVPASSAEAQTQPTPAGVPQSGGNAPGFEPFMQDGSGLGIVDLPNSGHGDTVQILPNCDGSPSVGGTNGGDIANGNSAESMDPNADEEDTIAFGDPAGLMDRVVSYDELQDSGAGDDEDYDVEADGWRGAASRAATSFRRSTRVRRPNIRLKDYDVEIPASLVIQAVNLLLEPQSVDEAL